MARQAKGVTFPIVYKADLKGLNDAEGALQKFGKVAAGIGAAAIGAVTGVAVAGVRAFTEFDSKLQQSVAIMGDVSDALRTDMSDAAREVAKTTTFSAAEAAESYFFLASAGLSAEQSIAALPQVAAFAQAGMFDMATATDLLTDAQSALGLTSEDTAVNLQNMTELSDVLVKANTLANASVSQFSEALTNKAAASMRSLNIDMEEGVAVLAVFADQGIKGSQAGTTFNATIRGLTQGVQRNAAEFQRLGVEVFNADGEFNNMADIVSQLEGALGGLSVEQQRAELTALGMTEETLAGTLALLGNSDAIREYESELRNAGGTVDEVAGKQLETFSSQLELMKSQFEDIGIEVGSVLVPILSETMTSLGPVIGEIGVAVGEAFEEMAPALAEIAGHIPGLVQAFIPLIPIITELAVLFLELAAMALPIIVEMFEALLPPILELAPLIAEVLLVALEALLPVFLTLVELLAPLIEAMLPPLLEIFTALSPVILSIVEAFLPLIELALPLLIGFIEFLTPLLVWLAELLGDILVWAIEKFADFVVWLADKIYAFAIDFAKNWYQASVAITDNINDMITGFESLVNFFVGMINKIIEGVNLLRKEMGQAPLRMVAEVEFGRVSAPELPGILQDFYAGAARVDTSSLEGVMAASGRVTQSGQSGRFTNTSTLEGILGASGLPRLAEGGLVNRETLALIGEAGPEAVIPLDKFDSMGTNYYITVNAGVGDPNKIAQEIVGLIKRYERTSGPVFARA
jgi:TP901 family phage tail tape measure protein